MSTLNTKNRVVCVPGSLPYWTQNDPQIISKQKDGYFHLVGFEIASCPRFEDNETLEDSIILRKSFVKALRRQKIFIDSFRSMMPIHLAATVELRIINNPSKQQMRLVLVFSIFAESVLNDSDAEYAFQSIESILPEDNYIFLPLPAAELERCLRLPEDSQITEVKKEVILFPVGSLKVLHSGADANLVNLLTSTSSRNEADPLHGTKQLVPVVRYLSWNENNWLSFWSGLQSSPAEIVLRLSLTNASAFAFEQAYANQNLDLLNLYYVHQLNFALEPYLPSLLALALALQVRDNFQHESVLGRFASKDCMCLQKRRRHVG